MVRGYLGRSNNYRIQWLLLSGGSCQRSYLELIWAEVTKSWRGSTIAQLLSSCLDWIAKCSLSVTSPAPPPPSSHFHPSPLFWGSTRWTLIWRRCYGIARSQLWAAATTWGQSSSPPLRIKLELIIPAHLSSTFFVFLFFSAWGRCDRQVMAVNNYLKGYPYLFVRETDQTNYFCTICDGFLKEEELQVSVESSSPGRKQLRLFSQLLRASAQIVKLIRIFVRVPLSVQEVMNFPASDDMFSAFKAKTKPN